MALIGNDGMALMEIGDLHTLIIIAIRANMTPQMRSAKWLKDYWWPSYGLLG